MQRIIDLQQASSMMHAFFLLQIYSERTMMLLLKLNSSSQLACIASGTGRERQIRDTIGRMDMDLLLRRQAAASHLISESINYDDFFN